MRFLPVNLDALLVELDDLAQTLALLASLQAQPIAGIEEIVPAARTLLVRYRPMAVTQSELMARIGSRSLTAVQEQIHPLVEIPVQYTGEDLEDVAGALGLSTAEVVRRHAACEYTVAFTGFAPGFAYLSGGDPGLAVPRRAVPRTRVPEGAVAVAGPFSGIYPKASPGGWQILGSTQLSMWDLARDVPALLQPGFRVRFIDATDRPRSTLSAASRRPLDTAINATPTSPALIVHRTGLQALFQDAGRTGLAAQGVSASGAMDRGALRLANQLVGNTCDSPCIELVYGGFTVESRGENVVALAGADASVTVTSGNGTTMELANHQAIALSDGDRLTLAEPRAGIRSYVAVRGGFLVTPVLGSCSTDTLAELGPSPIAVGDVLGVGAARHGVVSWPESARADLPTTHTTVMLDLVLGPRTDWFTEDAVRHLTTQLWHVTPQSNRVGLRLQGAQALERTITGELPSEGTVRGALQVPPSGQPVLFVADHPLTGGYPVIGTVAPHHLDRAGQIPIGSTVRFNPIQAFFSHCI